MDKALTIPFRATILSTLMAIPSIFISFLSKILTDTLESQGYIVSTAVILVASIKVPIVIDFGFKTNQVNESVDREARREQLRQQELTFAMDTRRQRQQKVTLERETEAGNLRKDDDGINLNPANGNSLGHASHVITVAEVH